MRAPSLALALALMTAPAVAQDGANALHNGSAMRIDIAGERIRISYVQPRPGLAEAGVYPGAVLFEGQMHGDVIMGEARAWKAGCTPAGYNVAGRIEAGGFVLIGPGPHRRGCNVVSLTPNSPHSRLPFTVTAPAVAAVLAAQADPRRTRTASEMLYVLRPGANREPSPAPSPALAPIAAPVPAPVAPVAASVPSEAPVTLQFAAPTTLVGPVPQAVTVAPAAPAPERPKVAVAAPAPTETPAQDAVQPAPLPTPSNPLPTAAPLKAKPKLDTDL